MLCVLVIFLLTLYSCIRGESILNVDLSDLNYLFFESKREHSPIDVMMFLMGEGKTKKDNVTTFARSIRNSDL